MPWCAEGPGIVTENGPFGEKDKGNDFGWQLLNGALKGMLEVDQRGNADHEHTQHLPPSPCRGLNCELVAGYILAVLARDSNMNDGALCPALDQIMTDAKRDKQFKLVGGLLCEASNSSLTYSLRFFGLTRGQ